MEKRKELILETIIAEHVKAGAPVSSGVLVDKYDLACSSATVRSEMAELEEAGWIYQPHTSAGRVPTEKAYLWQVDRLPEASLSAKELAVFKNSLGGLTEADFKQTAKQLAESSGLAVFWAFHRHNVYYTGLTNLLSQPEFATPGMIFDISAIIDRLEEIVDELFETLPDEPLVCLGETCPFGAFSGSVISRYQQGGNRGVFGIIGPVRMDFARNLALIKNIKNLIYEK